MARYHVEQRPPKQEEGSWEVYGPGGLGVGHELWATCTSAGKAQHIAACLEYVRRINETKNEVYASKALEDREDNRDAVR